MSLLKSKRFNDWPLFYAIVAVNSLIVAGILEFGFAATKSLPN